MEKDNILSYLREKKSFLQDKFCIEQIGIFGSFARDEANENSDIDIIIKLNKDAKNIYTLKKTLREYLKKELQRDIDLARVKYLKPYIKEEILKEAIFV